MDIKLSSKNIKDIVKETIEEISIEPLKPYEALINANSNSESIHYTVFYKGKKINNVTKIIIDNRIKE